MFYPKEEQKSTVSEWDMNYRERRRLVGGARALAVTFLSSEPASQRPMGASPWKWLGPVDPPKALFVAVRGNQATKL